MQSSETLTARKLNALVTSSSRAATPSSADPTECRKSTRQKKLHFSILLHSNAGDLKRSPGVVGAVAQAEKAFAPRQNWKFQPLSIVGARSL